MTDLELRELAAEFYERLEERVGARLAESASARPAEQREIVRAEFALLFAALLREKRAGE